MSATPFISGNRCSVEESSMVTIGPGAEVAPNTRDNSPSINVVREGNDVKLIEVQCQCGKITRIACDYK